MHLVSAAPWLATAALNHSRYRLPTLSTSGAQVNPGAAHGGSVGMASMAGASKSVSVVEASSGTLGLKIPFWDENMRYIPFASSTKGSGTSWPGVTITAGSASATGCMAVGW